MNLEDLEKFTVADQVRDFYDQHPYPPPVADLDEYRQKWQDEGRRRADFHLFWPTKPYRDEMQILVAGCGTSQAARYALRYPAAQIVGIDVSSTSIQETERLKRKYELANLELVQLPVERVEELNLQFDKIVCTGVLHHLLDPQVGLHALRKVLKPDGALHLMVYATYGRTGIYMIQEYCRLLGISTSNEEVTELAEALMALPLEHPLARLLGEAPDFRRKAALADALLNPQDQSYTVPQLFNLFESSNLRFGRWLRQAPYLPHCGDLADSPHASRLAKLPVEEQFAAVELFRGTMLRHSAIIYRNDSPFPFQPVHFESDDWRSYIPHRIPGTIVIEEKLPPGAAAVLLNRGHTDSDIHLPIDSAEMHLYENIDGRLKTHAVIEKAGVQDSQYMERSRSFFERLWRYDQVVFDTSTNHSS